MRKLLRRLALAVVAGVLVAHALARPAASLDVTLGAVAQEALAVGIGWWLIAVVATLLGRLPGLAGRAARAVADVVTPRLLRRLLCSVAGAAVAGAPVAPAFAAPPAAFPHAPTATAPSLHSEGTLTAFVGGLPAPDRPAPDHPAPRSPAPGRVPPTSGSPAADAPVRGRVVVQSGDTLWDIAARHLGPLATDEQIAAEWPRWWRRNATVVGRDPDVLRPGQVLVAP